MFNWKWSLKELDQVVNNKYKVFGTFLCAGGSSMGYKLAGYQHLGGVEIDPRAAELYSVNLKPKYLYVEDIREFNKRSELPKDLFDLDILDGSPPCSTFSVAGSRESAWDIKKKFREGQTSQRLDDLCFAYIETIEKLKPKIAILENVAGIVFGNAKFYSRAIVNKLKDIGYQTQIFMLNSATMGVPQSRGRVFFICYRESLNLPKLELNFDEKPIFFGTVKTHAGKKLNPNTDAYKILLNAIPSDTHLKNVNLRVSKKGGRFGSMIISDSRVFPTLTSQGAHYLKHEMAKVCDADLISVSSFPHDYEFLKQRATYYLGMSVPPIMTAQIAKQIKLQWLDVLS